MDTEHRGGDVPPNNPGIDYERTDLSVRGIAIFLVGVAVAGIAVHLLLWGLFVAGKMLSARWLDQEPNPMVSSQKLPPAPPLQNAGPQSVESFPEPRLQTNDVTDMNKLLLLQEQQLNPSQPYRGPDGTIRISIDDAMRLIVQRGLPVRSPGQSNPSTPAQGSASAPQGAQ